MEMQVPIRSLEELIQKDKRKIATKIAMLEKGKTPVFRKITTEQQIIRLRNEIGDALAALRYYKTL